MELRGMIKEQLYYKDLYKKNEKRTTNLERQIEEKVAKFEGDEKDQIEGGMTYIELKNNNIKVRNEMAFQWSLSSSTGKILAC